ncbi:hypothetical protein DdX_02355 [Ditylenchus destructor]|uniref:Uncharacterized protein n=1 Tax=Ditylenchus destructor TaxID=166010 RepID=A0AAD4NH61_9BILA|nr:hypothetical protein DdX_02355 [Ditylenchus destructor]
MDKPISCDFPNVHNETNRVISSTISANDVQQPGRIGRPPFLRRVSQSDPHLDIPHFINSQEKSFHHILSGLSSFGLNKKSEASTESVDKTTMPSAPNLIQSQTQQVGSLDRNKSALELSSADSSFPPTAAAGLRKSSSVANYNLIPSDTKDTHAPILPEKTHLTPFVSHLFGHGHSSSHNSHHNISTIPEDEGLMMSVRPTAATGISAASTLTSTAGGLMGSDSASATSPPRSGIFGVFGRGFFAKPVIRSEEENYRYIMALDR